MRQHLVGAGTSLTQKIKDVMGCDECIAEYEDIKKSSRVNSAGRAAYIERNYWMINDSDYSIIFLHLEKQNGGTRVAYDYAKRANARVLLL